MEDRDHSVKQRPLLCWLRQAGNLFQLCYTIIHLIKAILISDPGVLQSMGSQKFGHDLVTEQQQLFKREILLNTELWEK